MRAHHSVWHAIGVAYRRHILDAGREQSLWLLVAFLLTFVAIRFVTRSIRDGRGPFRNLSVGGTHLHHLVPGILLMIVTGYLATAIHPRAGRTTVAVLFGVGAALTLDEFALWVHLKDVYWTKQGRRSVDVVVVAAAIGGIALLGVDFWVDAVRAVVRRI